MASPRLTRRTYLIGNKKTPANRGSQIHGADNGARTRDPHLGKVVLYQLSHVRVRESTIRKLPPSRNIIFEKK